MLLVLMLGRAGVGSPLAPTLPDEETGGIGRFLAVMCVFSKAVGTAPTRRAATRWQKCLGLIRRLITVETAARMTTVVVLTQHHHHRLGMSVNSILAEIVHVLGVTNLVPRAKMYNIR